MHAKTRVQAYLFTFAAVAALTTQAALATPPPPLAVPETTSTDAVEPTASCFFSCLKRSSQLFGDLFGVRSALSKHGITLTASETSELLGNVSGGTQRGFAYDGVTQASLQLDTQRAFGHYGGTVNISALQIHGANLSENNLDTLQTASGIEADPSTRLWEAWYQQELKSEDRLDIKIGQQSLDQEFMVNQNSLIFVNTMFGWPMVPSADLPGGGPAYPSSALGVRLRARPNNSIALLGGVFGGSPVHTGGGGTLAIGEVQYSYPGLGAMVYSGRRQPLARTIKVGGWYDSERFDDLAIATPLSHHGNYSMYATIDQMLAQDPRNPYKTLNLFARAMGTPLGNQNTIAFSVDGGLTLTNPLPHRRDDTLGIGFGYTRVSSGAAAADSYTAKYANGFSPVRGSETFLEATYQMQLRPWLQIQPDIQFVMNPGAGVVNPNNPNHRIGNETVFGIRSIIQL